MAAGHQFDLPYSIELWDQSDDQVEELIALTADYGVARAAYEEAVKRRPGRIITLRQKKGCWPTAGGRDEPESTSANLAVTKMTGLQNKRPSTHGNERRRFPVTWKSVWTVCRLGSG